MNVPGTRPRMNQKTAYAVFLFHPHFCPERFWRKVGEKTCLFTQPAPVVKCSEKTK
jgi:hypothetical protein